MPGRWDFGYFQVWVTRSLRYIPIPHQVLTTGPFFIFWTEGETGRFGETQLLHPLSRSPCLPLCPGLPVSSSFSFCPVVYIRCLLLPKLTGRLPVRLPECPGKKGRITKADAVGNLRNG